MKETKNIKKTNKDNGIFEKIENKFIVSKNNNSTGFVGVCFDYNSYRCSFSGKHISGFKTAEEAARAYDDMVASKYGNDSRKTNKSLGLLN